MERDDLIRDHEYSLLANHDEEHGKEIRKKIWVVTGILTAITLVEVIIGAFIKQYDETGGDNVLWPYVKIGFIILTVVKAAYIVLIFMHLGDEKKNLQFFILPRLFKNIFKSFIFFFLELVSG